MKDHGGQIAISAVAFLFLVAHLIWPSMKIDAITLTLLVICFIPWFGSIFKSVEFHGGGKIEYRERLLRASQKLEEAGLLQEGALQPEDPVYRGLIRKDPNLALAGLRIDIERKLRQIVGYFQPDSPPRNLRDVVELIGSKGLFTKNQTNALHGILKTLNIAVHGGRISQTDAEEIMEKGSRLLSSLEKRINKEQSVSKATP